MHEAIDTLMREHRVIEQVLGVLAATAEEARSGLDVPRARVAELAEFFARFADRCHHAKEEDILFARLIERGFSAEAGPVGVMLQEHEIGRAEVRALAAIGSGQGPLSDEERQSLVRHGRAYAAFLAQHIAKEDHVLYPMALEALSTEELDELAARFAAHESKVMGPGEHERLHRSAERLVAAAGDGARLPKAAPPCHSCGE